MSLVPRSPCRPASRSTVSASPNSESVIVSICSTVSLCITGLYMNDLNNGPELTSSALWPTDRQNQSSVLLCSAHTAKLHRRSRSLHVRQQSRAIVHFSLRYKLVPQANAFWHLLAIKKWMNEPTAGNVAVTRIRSRVTTLEKIVSRAYTAK